MSLRLQKEVEKRRTFAIISHPDAGKTTLTEKLLLYGGAIHLAGAVKAKANQKHTTSDWMEIEKQRGISITSSALQFEYQDYCINILDTPGHKDFSEDTYRTLIAADAAVMLIDAAKGVEAQTKKLFEVCRMRGIPIFTFINKMDRPCKDPFVLLDELEKVLNIQSYPMNWPIGLGDQFSGIFDRLQEEVLVFQTEGEANVKGRLLPQRFTGLDLETFTQILKSHDQTKDNDDIKELFNQLHQSLELLSIAGETFSLEKILNGTLTPVFFGSAMNNFGVERFLNQFLKHAPAPTPRNSSIGPIDPIQTEFSGFIFKIQANMDPLHRDRVAFLRVCSGKFERNITVKHQRTHSTIKLSKPLTFFAQERIMVDEAWPGDIIGLLDTNGQFQIGDTLCTKGQFCFSDVPSFHPEYFSSIHLKDPIKRKQLQKGLYQLAEEGVVQIYRQENLGDKDPIIGAVGALQFEVLEYRLKSEYGVSTVLEKLPFVCARWILKDNAKLKNFTNRDDMRFLIDRNDQPLIIFKSEWALRWLTDNCPNLELSSTASRKIVIK
jgi:peptide chain release factor 3